MAKPAMQVWGLQTPLTSQQQPSGLHASLGMQWQARRAGFTAPAPHADHMGAIFRGTHGGVLNAGRDQCWVGQLWPRRWELRCTRLCAFSVNGMPGGGMQGLARGQPHSSGVCMAGAGGAGGWGEEGSIIGLSTHNAYKHAGHEYSCTWQQPSQSLHDGRAGQGRAGRGGVHA